MDTEGNTKKSYMFVLFCFKRRLSVSLCSLCMVRPQQSNPRYGPQQDKLQDVVHDSALSIHSQVDHQGQSVLRQGHRQGEGSGRGSLVHNLQQQQQQIPSRGELLGQHGLRSSTAAAGDQGHRQHYRIQHHFQQQQQQQQSRRGLTIGGSFLGEDPRDRMSGGVTSHHHQKQQLDQRRHRHQKHEDDSLAAMYLQQSAETLATGDCFLSQRVSSTSTSTGRERPGGILDSMHHDHYDQQLDQHQQRGGRGRGGGWDDTLIDVLHNKVGLRNEDPLLEDAQRGVEVGYCERQGDTGRVYGSQLQRLDTGDGNESSPGLLYKHLGQHEDYQQQQRLNRQFHQLHHGGGNSSRVDLGLGGLLSDLRDDPGYFS